MCLSSESTWTWYQSLANPCTAELKPGEGETKETANQLCCGARPLDRICL